MTSSQVAEKSVNVANHGFTLQIAEILFQTNGLKPFIKLTLLHKYLFLYIYKTIGCVIITDCNCIESSFAGER